MQTEYEPQEYWQKRLSKDFSLGGVGFLGLGLQYNKWLYRGRLRALTKLLKASSIDPRGKTVLDVGVGTGFYIDYWRRRGAKHVKGVDITEKSVSSLKLAYPQYEFVRADISARELPISHERFDIITAFDVLFHIVDEERFRQALSNLRQLSHKGTQIIISDNLLKEPLPPVLHQNSRTLDRYERALAEAGLEQVAVAPIFFFMNNPIDRNRLNTRLLRGSVSMVWRCVAVLPLVRRLGRFGEAIGFLVGLILYLLDGIALRSTAIGPGSKLLLAQPRVR